MPQFWNNRTRYSKYATLFGIAQSNRWRQKHDIEQRRADRVEAVELLNMYLRSRCVGRVKAAALLSEHLAIHSYLGNPSVLEMFLIGSR